MAFLANSRMYNISPQAAQAWADLFDLCSRMSHIKLNIIDYPAPLDLENLWSRDNLALCFMCGYPFIQQKRHTPIAAPIPLPSRYKGKAVYSSDLIVHKDSNINVIEDSFGKCLAHTIPHSQSGFNALRYFLLGYVKHPDDKLYSKTTELVTAMQCLEHVVTKKVDIAPLESFYHDLIRKYTPEKVKDIRVIATTKQTPIPLFVASPNVPQEVCNILKQTLCYLGEQTEAQEILRACNISGFTEVNPKNYQVLSDMAEEAENFGYLKPA